MNRDWAHLRKHVDRFAKDIGAPAFAARTGFRVERTARAGTKMSVPDFRAVEGIRADMENLYVWLWNAKDWIARMLSRKIGSAALARKMVEQLVDQTPELKWVADVANGTKHGELTKSRSGKFVRLGNLVTSMPVFLGYETPTLADQRLGEARAYIALVDRQDKQVGDATEVALKALRAWERFVAQQGLD